MGLSMLNIWVSATDNPCTVDNRSYIPPTHLQTVQHPVRSNYILAQGKFRLQFPSACFSSSPSHLAVVGERYHAFRFQATRSGFYLPCPVK